jgi:pSer/pThr/pTyr-binding forkhead associated (FHA) protein
MARTYPPTGSQPPSVELIVRQGPRPGQRFTLTQSTVTIGREVGNDVVINDPQVSRRHASLTWDGSHFIIQDLGSANGTFVNKERISGPHSLQDGDLLGLGGQVQLAFRAVMPVPSDKMPTMAGVAAPTIRGERVEPPGGEPAPPPVRVPPPEPPGGEPAEPAPAKRRNVTLVLAALLGLCFILAAIGGLAYFFWPQEKPTPIIIVATLTPTPPSQVPTLTPLSEGPAQVPTPTAASPSVSVDTGAPAQLVQPSDLVYQGAFRLPGEDVRPATFAYGGNAMTFNPNGDPSGADDGFPGSLFVTGHDRLAYGELPDGSQVAEISIPEPVISVNLADLNQAGFLQGFHNVAKGFFRELEEIPRIGMQYLDTAATGAKIHLAWGQHMPPDQPVASHAWFDPNLSAPNMQGTWFIGNQSTNSVNGYIFEIPASWADQHTGGRYLATGRFRDGGWGGMGPALFAYRPWVDDTGTPASSGTHLEETVLLLYESSSNTENIEHCLDGYQHPDEWEGGAWMTTSTGKSAVLFAGTKGSGAKYWYGWVNPAGPEHPCVEEELIGQFTLCRLADGTPCPSGDLTECEGHSDYRGWWSSRFDAQFILYDPTDLAQVAAGEIESWAPQPYASLDIDEYLFLPPGEQDMLGAGVQRRSRIGAVAYDRNNDLLYVLELYADEAKPVVHVWKVEG